ncbi:M50 family peptidase [Candidatus Woesearchaeota archaeon]|nr:MAG: M50 family peptidase [Candidatus Woesearchaeota archaeon]
MIFTIRELIDVILMTLAVGFIFKDLFGTIKKPFLFSCLVTAPALIVHELFHKFVALGLGLEATFHAAYPWLALGLLLKLANFGFIFFVPAYVSIGGEGLTALSSALISFAGPGANLFLFLLAYALLKQKKLKTKTYLFLAVTKQINLFLFIFNMLPIPGFDGFKFYQALFRIFF